MAFPIGWNRQCALVIQHTLVTADQTAFPVCLTNATNCLPAEMVTLGGGNAAQADGGDIRFSSDSAGTAQLACEIVQFVQNATASSAVVEIWVPVSILTAVDVTIYVWYNAGGGQTQPAANAAFGSQAVWDSSYKNVQHFGDGTTLSVADSTSNANNGTNNSGAAAAGKFGGGVNFASAANYISFAAGSPTGTAARTIEMWVKTSSAVTAVFYDQGVSSTGQRDLIYTPSAGVVPTFDINGASIATQTGNVRNGAWHYLAMIAQTDITNTHFYIDNTTPLMTSANLALNTAATPIFLNASIPSGGTGQVGLYDEFRISNVIRSAAWLLATYNTQNSPGTFTIAGSPTTPGGGGSTKANPFSGVSPIQGFLL